ncbi:MAG TPA: WD40 repeat domain-containing protein [Patescibacteria group bacterium]|nr:WD40 repeat domain-containing protein [Patescibacteria group bacterium]
MKEIFPRWVGLFALTSLMILMMFNADFLYHKAWALEFSLEVNNTDETHGIVRAGNQIWVASESDDTVRVWSTSGVLIASIAATDPEFMWYDGRVYVYSSQTASVVYEFDPLNPTGGILRTSGSLTTCTSHAVDYEGNRFFCGTGATNTIKILNLSTFVITTSSTLNTGVSACNVISAIAYDSTADALFASCNTSSNVVVVEGIATSGTPDYSTAYSDDITTMTWNSVQQELWADENTGTDLVVFDVDTTADTILEQIVLTGQGAGAGDGSLSYHADTDRIFLLGSDEILDIRNGGSNSIITSVNIPDLCGSGTFGCSVTPYSATFVYISSGTTNKFWELDLTGVGVGGGSESPTPASVCYVDKNFDGIADFIFNDVGGPDGFPTVGNPDAGVPDGMCDWSGFGTTSPPPIIDAGGGLICLTGIIPCTNGQPTDPNPQTNGLGYLLVIFLLAIMILLFGVAQMKLELGIPDWLWMIGTFAVIGFATLVGWIDSTLFIIGAVIIAALGAVSFIKKFAGGF